MTEESILSTVQKTFIPLLIKEIWLIILLPTVLAISAYFYSLCAEIISDPRYPKYSLVVLAMLLFTTILFFLLWLRLCLKEKKFLQAYGVFWDKKFNIRCLYCCTPLKNSSKDHGTFFCPNPNCKQKYILKDDDNNYLTKQEAIKRIKAS